MTTKKPKTKTKAKIKKAYQVTLEVNDVKIKTQGDTLLEAFDLLKVDDIRTWALLTVRKGKLEAEQRFNNIVKLKRFLNVEVIRIITAKNLELFLK